MPLPEPRVLVLTTLFPRPAQRTSGIFIRERMFRVANKLPIAVVAPVPWFPFQGVLRYWKAGFRPSAPAGDTQDGIEVIYPRFFSIPGAAKWLDGFFLAACCVPTMFRLRRRFRFDVIDAHFAYPEGYAASLLGRWFHVPVTITLRGTEHRHAQNRRLRPRLVAALTNAWRVITVSSSLKALAVSLGVSESKVTVVGNGVDWSTFSPIDRSAARAELRLNADARVLVGVGGLVERKGFHRVIELLPELRRKHPNLMYLIVGGPGPEGDWTGRLEAQVRDLKLGDCVRFLGELRPSELARVLSAADVFVLATANEGWANVFLEAMACGLPVVTTDVGGNREVVCDDGVGTVVPFGDPDALRAAIDAALDRAWDRRAIRQYAERNGWDDRVESLVEIFRAVHSEYRAKRRTDFGSSARRDVQAG